MRQRVPDARMTKINDETISRMIASIYAAAYSDSGWLPLVEEMQRLFDGSKACLSRVGPNLQLYDSVTTNFDEYFARKIMEMYAAQADASIRLLSETIQSAPEGAIYSEISRFGRGFLQSDVWNEWYMPQDMYGGLTCKLLSDKSSSWFFDIQRGRNQPAFDETDAALLTVLAPHLRRAAEISQHFKAARALSLAASNLPFGIIVVNVHLRILSANAFADALLTRSDGVLAARSGILAVKDRRQADRFSAFVAGACGAGGQLEKERVGGDILLDHGNGSRFAVSIVPLAEPEHSRMFLEPCATVIIRDLESRRQPGFDDHIRSLFKLTASEARLAAGLASGQSLKESAESNGIRISTARSYLEVIFRKTGVRQQSQLVALLNNAKLGLSTDPAIPMDGSKEPP